jgi:NADPH:quinone reductase
MRAVKFDRFGDPTVLTIEERPPLAAGPGIAVVAVEATAINPSDVKNVAGRMHQTRPPRVPGRDYAGTVVAGPEAWLGMGVWGSGGDVGFTRDGTHAEQIEVPVESLRLKPARLTALEAGSVGVPFVTAQHALASAGLQAGETLVIIGAGGDVGSAAAQIARLRGCRVVAVTRTLPEADDPVRRWTDAVVTSADGFPEAVRDLTGGAQVVLDCVGGSLLPPALACLARRGRLIALTVGDRPEARFDMADFYHNESRLIGIDSLSLDLTAAARILDTLSDDFAHRRLHPTAIAATYSLDAAVEAYTAVGRPRHGRVVLLPNGSASHVQYGDLDAPRSAGW